jgi:hypothetical protein
VKIACCVELGKIRHLNSFTHDHALLRQANRPIPWHA